jgi:hypothetical protein
MNTPVEGPDGCCCGSPGVLDLLPPPIDCSAAPAEPSRLLPRLPCGPPAAASPALLSLLSLLSSTVRGRNTPVEGPATWRLACRAAAAATAAILLALPPAPAPP